MLEAKLQHLYVPGDTLHIEFRVGSGNYEDAWGYRFAGTAARPSAASASIVAAMGGGLVGAIGPDLSDGEKRRALEAEYQALEYTQGGETVSWQSGRVRGEVVAYQPYRVGSQDCRQYMHTLNEAGPPRSVRGTACRNPNGSWSPLV